MGYYGDIMGIVTIWDLYGILWGQHLRTTGSFVANVQVGAALCEKTSWKTCRSRSSTDGHWDAGHWVWLTLQEGGHMYVHPQCSNDSD